MPEITPSFVMQYERRMKAITESEYVRRLLDKYTWWNKVFRKIDIEGKTERVTWMLSTAMIEPIGPSGSGNMDFENMVTQTVEYPTFRHGKGIVIQRDQLEDLDGTGLSEASEWSAQIGNEQAYYPQRLGTQLLLNGANTDGSATAYDGQPFFDDATLSTIGGFSVPGHPYNPYKPVLGGYPNWLHGAAATVNQPNGTTLAYPGALPIHDGTVGGVAGVTVDVALQNLGILFAYIAAIKMPNGVDPRFLSPVAVLGAPRLAPRLRQLFNTQNAMIAQAAASGGGGANVGAIIEGFEMAKPLIAHELGASFKYTAPMPFMSTGGNVSYLNETISGSDTTYYVICQEMKTTQLGGLLYVQRKPFKVNYFTGDTQVELDRRNEFEYHVQGRMSAQYGHPYTIIRVDAS